MSIQERTPHPAIKCTFGITFACVRQTSVGIHKDLTTSPKASCLLYHSTAGQEVHHCHDTSNHETPKREIDSIVLASRPFHTSLTIT